MMVLIVLSPINIFSNIENTSQAKADSILIILKNFEQLELADVNNLCNEGLEIANKLNSSVLKADFSFQMGRYYHYLGNYPASYKNLIHALNIYEELKLKSKIAHTYRMLGESNRATNNFPVSLKYLDKSIKIFFELKDTIGIANAYNRKAAIFLELVQYDSLNYFLNESNRIIDSAKVGYKIKSNNYNIYAAYIQHTEPQKAEKYFKEALEFLEKENMSMDKPNILLNLGWLKFKNNDLESALEYAKDAYKLSNELKVGSYIMHSSNLLAIIYKELNDYENALHFRNINGVIKDTILGAKNTQKILYLQQEYENEKIAKQNEYKAQINYLKILLLIVLSAILIIIVIMLNLRHKTLAKRNSELESKNEIINNQAEELSRLNKDKDLLFSILTHDLKNPLSSMQIISRVYLDEFNNLSNDEKLDFMKDITEAANSAGMLIENLLVWSRSQRNLLQIFYEETHLSMVIKNQIQINEHVARAKNVNIKNNISDDLYIVTDPNLLSIIIGNFISNSIKFSYRFGIVQISSRFDEELKIVEISVADNGIGMTNDQIKNLFKPNINKSSKGTENESGTGLGLIICSELVNKLSGKILVESSINKGSTFTLQLPMKKLEL